MWNNRGPSDLSECSSSGQHLASYESSHGQMASSGFATKEKELSLYDSGRTDSGFLSGANLTSEHSLTSEDLNNSSSVKIDSCQEDSKNLMRLDSGVDLGLSEKLVSLTLKDSYNNLNKQSTKSSSQVESCSNVDNIPVKTISPKSNSRSQLQSSIPVHIYYQQDEDGDTQLHIAIIQGFIEVVYSLIRMAPASQFLDVPNEYRQTPLHLAVHTRQPLVVRRLLVAGAQPDTRDRLGNTPLHIACQLGDMDCVAALTEPITNNESKSVALLYQPLPVPLPGNLELRNYEGQTCVHLATYEDHAEVLRHLAWCGADMNSREGRAGRTALHMALERHLPHAIQFLLTCKSVNIDININVRDYAGHTPLYLAKLCRSPLCAKLESLGARAEPSLLADSDSDSDNDDSDVEMYQFGTCDYFTGLRRNGGTLVV